MCTCKTAIRRRRQAANNYRHLSKQRRPHYNKVSKEKSENREAMRRMKEMQFAANRARSKKKK